MSFIFYGRGIFGLTISLPKLYTFLVSGDKKCNYCGRFYPESSFGVALTTPAKIYRRRKCRDCYRSTKAILAQKYLLFINQAKEVTGCKRCGIKDARVLDFHHKNGNDKLFAVGTFRREVGIQRIKDEIQKCEVVCANCHRVLHFELREQIRDGA